MVRQNKFGNPYGNPSTSMLDSSASLTGAGPAPGGPSNAFNPSLQTINASETDIPLHASPYNSDPNRFNPSPSGNGMGRSNSEQTWDSNGRAVGYSTLR